MSKNVFDLVKSLTKREKAYFNRFASTYSGSKEKNYLLLYEALMEMEEYNVEALKHRFAGSTIAKYLSSESDYLEEQLLKSLANFYFDSTPHRELQKDILFIDILIEKGFQKRALKILAQAKKIAYRNEDFTTILKLIQLEEEILFEEGILGFTKKLGELQAERQHITNQIQNLNELRLLREQARELQFTELFVTDPSKFPHIFANPLMETENNALSISAKEHWMYIREIRYYLTRQYKKGQLASSEYLAFMEENTHLVKPSKMHSTISNYLYFSVLLGDTETFFATLPKLEKMLAKSPSDTVYILYIKYARIIELFYQTDDPRLYELATEAGVYLTQNHEKMGNTQVNYMALLMVKACLETGHYKVAADWLIFWNHIGPLEHTLIQNRLMTLILYLESGWNDLLESATATAYKTLRSHKKYDKLAAALISFFKTHLKKPNDIKINLEQLSTSLAEIKASPEDNKAFIYYDFHKWCERKKAELGI